MKILLCTKSKGILAEQRGSMLLQDADAEQLGEVKSIAADAVAAFLRNMDTFQFDLLENPAVQQLKGDSQYGSLFSLLELMLAGNMKVSSAVPPSSSAVPACVCLQAACRRGLLLRILISTAFLRDEGHRLGCGGL